MEDNGLYIQVKLHSTGQVIDAVYHSPLSLDRREERPNVEAGTEVGLLYDDIDNFYLLGSTNQQIVKSGTKARRFKKNDLFEIETEKLNIHNQTDDLIKILSDFMQEVINLKIIAHKGKKDAPDDVDILEQPHTKISVINTLKAKIDAFKVS